MEDSLGYGAALKRGLAQAIEDIHPTGSFAAWGALRDTPPPGLNVDGVGNISVPLSGEQIQLLIEKAYQERPGLSSTPCDKIFEFPAAQLELCDPDWQTHLLQLAKTVATKLGVDKPIQLNLEKMIIYGEGATTAPRIDHTEGIPGMFGTLTMCLPSAHTGGEYVLKRNGESKTLGRSDANHWSFVCWYSGVSHELLPVRSGHRCALIYQLATSPDHPRPSADILDLQKLLLRTSLKNWLRDLANNYPRDVPSHLYHALEAKYSKAPTSTKELKVQDFTRMRALQDLTHDLPFSIFMALLQKEEKGPIRYTDCGSVDSQNEMEQVAETLYTVKALRTLDRTVISRDFKFDSSFCLAQNPFQYMPNPSKTWTEDDEAIYQYHRAALVIVPHERLGTWMARCATESPEDTDNKSDYLGNNDDVCGYLCADLWHLSKDQYFNDCHSALSYLSSIPSAQKTMLNTMCILCISIRHPKLERIDFLKVAFQYSHYALFQTAAFGHRGGLPFEFFDWAMHHLQGLPDELRAEKYHVWIPLLIQSYPSMNESLKLISDISNFRRDPADSNSVLSSPEIWAQDVTRRCITNFPAIAKKPTVSDGELIVNSIFDLREPWPESAELIVSVIDRFPQAHALAFVFAMLLQLHIRAKSEGVPIGAIQELYRTLSRRLFNHRRRLCDIITTKKVVWRTGWGRVVFPPPPGQSIACNKGPNDKTSADSGLIVHPEALVQHACNLNDLSRDPADFLEPFLEEISARCSTFSGEDMAQLWMPFLYQLIPALNSRSVYLNKPAYQRLASRFLEQMEQTMIGTRPQVGLNFPAARVSKCPCPECEDLNCFLLKSDASVYQIALPKKRRDHLVGQLATWRIPCDHRTLEIGRPHALVITKKRGFMDEVVEWKGRRYELYSSFSEHLHHHLHILLAPEMYNYVRRVVLQP
ncbi:hypothetical protein PCASD_24475 [Puccinia coronata f. sp. avenae]|uniref:Prolyl 4-hydroxylase alpha subunit Fe(2+) 2OG dioxygenase domain-containing protein n=1 Tax=Puccinia coronata f. sp. avenae TaxID=200324 RepID=A0A2N5TLY4_9BASI|nr:hypothetical protein PCASD_24475 [Puccinia coronata f. sp. avenae]